MNLSNKSTWILFSSVGALALNLTSMLQPAVADPGIWRPYGNTNPVTSSSSTWKCAKTQRIDDRLGAQVCIIRSSSRHSIQGAVIVRNDNNYQYNVYAEVTIANHDTWDCSLSGVAANSWSVCFGKTISENDPSYSFGYANGTYLGATDDL